MFIFFRLLIQTQRFLNLKIQIFRYIKITAVPVIFITAVSGCGGLGEMYHDLLMTAPVCVDNISGDDSNAGYGWAAAVKTIQRASQIAGSGSEVWVKTGYRFTGSETISANDVHIYGGFIGNESRREERDLTAGSVLTSSYSSGDILTVSADGVIFDGLSFRDITTSGSVITVSSGKNVLCINCSFSGNTTANGAIYVPAGATVSIEVLNSVFAANTTSANGGAIKQLSGSAAVKHCRFNYCSAGTSSGGAVFVSDGSMTIEGCVAENCSAATGGFASCNSSAFTVKQSTCDQNSSSSNGGTFFVGNSTVSLTDSEISGSTSGGMGGSFYAQGGSFILQNMIITSNSSTSNGGALYCTTLADSSSSIKDSIIQNNHASNGGGISLTSSYLTVTNSTISGNTAAGLGGGIHQFGSSGNVFLNNCSVTGNTANNGGGIYNIGSNLNMTQSEIRGNTASVNGGGINQDGVTGTVTAEECIIAENTASGGGGVTNTGFNIAVTSILNRCIVTANTSSTNYSGGINCVSNGTVKMYNSLLYGNSGSSGQFHSASGSTVLVVNCTLFSAGTDTLAVFNAGNIRNCLFYSNGLISLSGTVTAGSSVSNISANGFTVYPLLADEFENPANGKFGLKSSSILIDAGDSAFVYGAYDLSGKSRILGSAVDLGAYEKR